MKKMIVFAVLAAAFACVTGCAKEEAKTADKAPAAKAEAAKDGNKAPDAAKDQAKPAAEAPKK